MLSAGGIILTLTSYVVFAARLPLVQQLDMGAASQEFESVAAGLIFDVCLIVP